MNVTDAGVVTVNVDGSAYVSATISNWASTNMDGWKFGYEGRTHGVAGTGWIDDLSITAAVKSSNVSQTGGLNVGDVVSVTANFSEAVTVTGTPQLALNIGGTTVLAKERLQNA